MTSQPVQVRNIEDIYPLSPMQQGMLFHDLLEPDSGLYLEQLSTKLVGSLDINAFQRAWQEVVNRHGILRTSYIWEDVDQPLQIVHRNVNLPLNFEDWQEIPELEQEFRYQMALNEDHHTSFDLEHPPLMRLKLFRFSHDEYRFVWSHHHILLDGWSTPMILGEVFSFYENLKDGTFPSLPLPRPYRDYIAWLQSQDISKAEAFWRKTLSGFVEPTPLVIDTIPRFEEKEETDHPLLNHFLTIDETNALRKFGQANGLTLNTLFQGAWSLLMSHYSGHLDVVFGSTVSGRPPELPGSERMVGLFINTLPVRTKIVPNENLLTWLINLQNQGAELRQYEYTPLVQIQQWSAISSGLSLFDSILVFENFPIEPTLREQKGSLQVRDVQHKASTNYPLTIVAAPGPQFEIHISYDAEKFDRSVVDRMLGHLCMLLRNMPDFKDRPVGDLPMMGQSEEKMILENWSRSFETNQLEGCLHQLFEKVVAEQPDETAVISLDGELTYRELDKRANRLAHYLIGKGVGPEVPVGICMKRSLELMIGIYGILKAGGLYVPIDPEIPVDRINYIIADAEIEILLTQQSLSQIFQGTVPELLCLDSDWVNIEKESISSVNSEVTAGNAAYIIYTSGSTGLPKGVIVEHRSIVNHAQSAAREFSVTTGIRMLHIMSISFDAAGEEIHPPLIQGGTLVIAPPDIEFTGSAILDYCKSKNVNILHLPTAVWHQVVFDIENNQTHIPDSLQTLVVGGESPSLHYLNIWCKAAENPIRFFNAYGPTEASVATTYFSVNCSEQEIRKYKHLPIGKPIQNVSVFVNDAMMKPTPIGVPGELYIGGKGVARGYQNQPELTKKNFIDVPTGLRLYKTGDRVMWMSDGNLLFIGRVDEQVKWRGYRIELGEIETALRKEPDIKDVVVVLREDNPGDKRLVAYLVAVDDKSLDFQGVRKSLLSALPDYMVPSHFVELDQLPLTATGKINRRMLPAPDSDRADFLGQYIAPRNPFEEILAGIFEDILNLELVGIHDNFFELGGHSLLATQLVSRIRTSFSIELPLRVVFDSPTVAGIAQSLDIHLTEMTQLVKPPIEVVDRNDDLPLSFSQQRLWFLDQLEPGNLFYNITTTVRLTGNLNVDALEKSINLVLRRHESLRTRFESIGGKPVQIIAPDLMIVMDVIDLEMYEESLRTEKALELTAEVARTPFDLANGPLFRVRLFRLSPSENIACFTVHHVVSDGWSMGVLVREIALGYQSIVNGQEISLPELPIQYADFSAWQRSWLQGETLQKQLDYWKEALSGIPPLLELPTDRPRPAIKTSKGDTRSFMISKQLMERIQELCRQEGITLYMALLAAFQTLLFRYSGQEDVAVGSAIANRTTPEIENLIGFFVNTLVLRTDLSGEPSFRELLGRVREVTLGAYAHQDLPFEMLVDAIQPERNLSYTPLFQVGFDVQTASFGDIQLPGLTISPIQVKTGTAEFDLLLSLTETAEGLIGSLEFNTDLFNTETIHRMITNFEVLIEGIIADPNTSIIDLPIMTEEEIKLQLEEWNNTQEDTDYYQCIHQKFEEWVEKQPDRPAVIFENMQLTYSELNRKANQVARMLRNRDVGKDQIVGIFMERSLEIIIGILGVLKAGAGYLPIDPSYPKDRITFMMEDAKNSQAKKKLVLLSQETLLPFIDQNIVDVILLDKDFDKIATEDDSNLQNLTDPDSLAYVIYTSGSTGLPKGTLLAHKGLCNLSEAQRRAFDITPGSRILQFSPLSFDASVWETFMALGNGAVLILARQDTLASGLDLIKLMKDEKITTVTLPPSLLSVLPEEELTELKTIIAAGEACSKEIVNRWAPGRKFFDAYGPTETTVCASMARCNAGDLNEPSIGRPLPNFQLYVVDQQIHPVPIGVPGELLVGGVGLAKGYLNRPEMNAEKFIPNPFEPGKRLYRTGDLVRYRTDGNLEFLGRIDNQVKVRGFRIELGEIESVLRQSSDVTDAVVIVREDKPGDKRITAYLIPEKNDDGSSKELSQANLRYYLREKLPEYMVPTYLVVLEVFPISPSGKIDRKALPIPETGRAELVQEYVAPSSSIEIKLVEICSELLILDKVGINDNFFELGGHSLLATQFISRVRDAFQVELPLRTLFEHPTIFELAIEIEGFQKSEHIEAAPTIRAVSRDQRRMKRSDLGD